MPTSSDVDTSDTIFVNDKDEGKLKQASIASIVETKIDTSLTKENFAADSKTVGTKLNSLTQDTAEKFEEVSNTIESIRETESVEFNRSTTIEGTTYGNALFDGINGYVEQETFNGVNILDYSKFNNGSAQGVSAKVMGDYIVLNGTPTSSYANLRLSNCIDIKAGEQYGWRFECDGETNNVFVGATADGGTYDATVHMQASDNGKTYTAKTNLTDVVIGATNITLSNFHLKICLTKGSPPEIWEPYTGGESTPNPDHPTMIFGNGKYGFWDSKFENGAYNAATGNPESGTNYIRCLNDIVYPLKSGDKIKFIYEKPVNIGICLFDKQGTLTYASSSKFAEWEYTVTKDQERFRFFILDKDGVTATSAKHLIITVNGQYALCVKSTGKNLLDFKTFLDSRGSQYTKSGDRYRITGTGTAFSQPIFLSDEDENFTLSGSVTSESGSGYSVQLLNKAGSTVATLRNEVTNVSGKGCKLRLNYSEAGAGIYENIMVEKGTSHEEYIPYQSNVTYIPVDYPLFEGDKIIQRNGEYKLIRQCNMQYFDGTVEWKKNQSGNPEDYMYYGRIDNGFAVGVNNNLLCDRFEKVENANTSQVGVSLSSYYPTALYVRLNNELLPTNDTEHFNQWLSEHPLTIVYKMDEPTEETLSSEAQTALYSIMSCDSQTDIEIVGSDTESSHQIQMPKTQSGAWALTSYATSKRNELYLQSLMNQNLDSRINKLEINAAVT